MNIADAYDIAAEWHDKLAVGCKAISEDEPRIAADVRAKAKSAAQHHAASAAALRLAAIHVRQKERRRG